MPASEKTWRDQKILHIVFGCTGLLLLISTVWMFAADHSRQWKSYQRKMRDVDVRLTDWRMQSALTQDNATEQEEKRAELAVELANAPNKHAFDKFLAELPEDADDSKLTAMYDSIDDADSDEAKRSARTKLQSELNRIVARVKFEEGEELRKRKFKSADYDEKRANYDLAIRDNKPQEEREELQSQVDNERGQRNELTRSYEQKTAMRKALQTSLEEMTSQADDLQNDIKQLEADYDRLATAKGEREATWFSSRAPFLGKKFLELPIVDAFNSPLKIDNLWTENLTIPNGSFGEVTRFDRCTTCHQAIDKTAPGSAVDPLYAHAHVVELLLETPASRPKAETNEDGTSGETPTLHNVYGITVADRGLIHNSDVAVQQISPGSFAANAKVTSGANQNGLLVGDVITYVRGSKVLSQRDLERYLMEEATFGEPLKITVMRGLPQPFTSHPRLDLFVGSLSPHPITVMGCSVCHEGQGSATDFKFASHTPNSPEEKDRWVKEYQWFNNHHWIYPMFPKRFAESSCLKCHHNVVELEIASQFDEPPAPKLTKGYHLIRRYGCFGCHEINGYEGPDKRIGPDMRLEPNYFAAAAQLKIDPSFPNLSNEVQGWVNHLAYHPESNDIRHQLLEFMKNDIASSEPILSASSHNLLDALTDVESPGQHRKVGPTLRHIADKVGPTWLYDWLRDPTHFRKSTRMPRFFGLYDHLDEGERETAERYEPIEILGIVRYLLTNSQPVDLPTPEADLFTASEQQVERGKEAFEFRGCLACHQHNDFPDAHANFGPNLSNIGDKFGLDDTPAARRWMYNWLKNPSLYHPRTKMPNLYLDPIPDEEGTTDPAADIAVYLMNSSQHWKPLADTQQLLSPNEQNLNDLLSEHLKTKLYAKDVEQVIANNQFSEAVAARLDGPEAILATGELTTEKKLVYIGQKTISKYGCYACHDIPGYEKAKPIGTGLADWGRKDPSKLAFEHIAEYLHGHGHGHGSEHGDNKHHDDHGVSSTHEKAEHHDDDDNFDESFYTNRLLEHDRVGFIWQKLKEPRSYDFGKARNKDSFNDRLRMPLFPFNNEEREAVITFVLGLLAEPPAHEFVFQPDARQEALIAGHTALTKFNCIGCHIVEPEKWTLEIPGGLMDEQPSNPAATFPFMPHQFTTAERDASAFGDPFRGTVSATVSGMPEIGSDTGTQRILDEEGDEWDEESEYAPFFYPFELWEPTLIDGQPYQVGVTPVELEGTWIKHKRPTFGGDLTKLLLPRAVEAERKVNPQADGKQAYGWLPPPLLGEGNKVQTNWLHSFLLEPFMIRPAVFMRMPKFNMSSDEASHLVNYFAAKSDVNYPYEFMATNLQPAIDKAEEKYQESLTVAAEKPPQGSRFDHAMNIVTSNDYCVQCHIVGDFVPKTSNRAMAPDLSVVYDRLRPNYLKRWIANPKQILPYTPMPVNVKYDANAKNLGGVSQGLYHGSSLDQLNGLVDLLMNYPRYAKSHATVSQLIQAPPVAEAESNAGGQ